MERAVARQLVKALNDILVMKADHSDLLNISFANGIPYVQLSGFKNILSLGRQPILVKKMEKHPEEKMQWYKVSVMFEGIQFLAVGTENELAEAGLAYEQHLTSREKKAMRRKSEH